MNCAIHLEKNAVGMCSDCGKHICEICLNKEAGKMYCDLCARLKAERKPNASVVMSKSRGTAAVLALLLGGLGAHKFYLGQTGMGILYLLFFWTFIPAAIAFVEAIIYITQSDEAFASKYGMKVYH